VLLNRADGDIALVRNVFDNVEILDAIVGFHAQQAVEKSLKAVLSASEVRYERTHALDYLIGLVEANGIDAPTEALAEAETLSGWAVEFRYETDGEPPLDRGAVLVLIEDIRSWAGAVIDG
jgi:HEPN domain-containing protein